ncbi:MAG: hypothetical protein WAP51_03460 [Candidatus Sungiibacteriota bacterium]
MLVIIVRLIAPLAILRWPFWGMLAAIAADASDVMIFSKLGWGILEGRGIYHEFDKIFDIYYLALAAYMALKWQDVPARRLAIVLFGWRLIGDVVFEITRVRQVLFFAPNIFENFYLIIAGLLQFFPRFALSKKRIAAILVIAAIPKIVQEYVMHYLEFSTWQFFKTYFFFWLY